jgi:hypothetical protein
MPLLNNIIASFKTGWKNLNSDDNLTMLTFLSVSYTFLIFANYTLLSNAIFSGPVNIFDVISVSASTVFIIFLALSACLGLFIGAIFNKYYHFHFQVICVFLGLLFGFLLYLPVQGALWIFIYSLIGGFVSSLGLTNILAAFLSKTNFTNRGSTAGIFILLVYVILFLFSLLVNSLRELAIVLVVLKIFSLFLTARITEFKFDSENVDYINTTSRIKLSFLIIWFIFMFSDMIAQTFISTYAPLEIYHVLGLYAKLIGLFAILFCGLLMDISGRKKLMMFAYAYLGANYALISFSNGILYQFTVFDGIAWGILTVLFLLVLWGDICKPSKRTVWIAASLSISIIGFPATVVAPHLIDSFSKLFATTELNIVDFFPFTSIFLFAAAVMILYLPETLPEKIIQKKELDDYIHMAKKIKQRYKKGKQV